MPFVHEITQSGLPIKIEILFARFSSALAVTAIFERENIGGNAVQKAINIGTIGDVSRVSVERKKRERGFFRRKPPGVQTCAVVGGNPNVFHRQPVWLPITR